jgi:hypothetical protein
MTPSAASERVAPLAEPMVRSLAERVPAVPAQTEQPVRGARGQRFGGEGTDHPAALDDIVAK